MQASEVKSISDAIEIVEERQLSNVKVGVFDVDGVLRGKYISKEKFFSSLDKGFGFCDVVLGWDLNDNLYDNVKYTDWHSGYPDAPVRVVPESCRELPFEPGGLFFLAEFSGKAETICPRGNLRRIIQKADAIGFNVKAGFEYEFFVFDETPESIREKHYRNLKPMAPGSFGYSVIRNSTHSSFYLGLLEFCQKMNISIEGLHEETGPGVLEAAIAADEALAATDKAAIFKTFAKVYAQHNDKIATFMSKCLPEWPSQSRHIHISRPQHNP